MFIIFNIIPFSVLRSPFSSSVIRHRLLSTVLSVLSVLRVLRVIRVLRVLRVLCPPSTLTESYIKPTYSPKEYPIWEEDGIDKNDKKNRPIHWHELHNNGV